MVILVARALAADPLVFDGVVPADGDFFTVPFEVPAGTVEIEVAHDDGSDVDILDWGLRGPGGRFRGWGGGNTEDAVVGVDRASRSYLPGEIEAGTWEVLVGKAQIVSADPRYHVEITLRSTPTLEAQPDRREYAAADLGGGPRWVAGDLHVHSTESGDASASMEAVAALAEERGLDFVALSEHNTPSGVTRIGAVQDAHPGLLLLPGAEITTYAGHANGIGLTTPVPFTMGFEGVDVDTIAAAVAETGALLSINHPVLDLGDRCIGCAWESPIPSRGQLAGVEIATGGWSETGILFTEDAIAFWDGLCAEGHHLAALGGSDDHRAGTGTGPFDSPIGDPTTRVWVDTLSVAGVLDGIRNGRTVVQLQGPADPMVTLEADPPPSGDTVIGDATTLWATVTGGLGEELHVVADGQVVEVIAVDADPFVAEVLLTNPTDRVRVEVWTDDHPITVTSHLWVEWPIPPPPGGDGCGCAGRPRSEGGPGLLLPLLWVFRRRREVRCG